MSQNVWLWDRLSNFETYCLILRHTSHNARTKIACKLSHFLSRISVSRLSYLETALRQCGKTLPDCHNLNSHLTTQPLTLCQSSVCKQDRPLVYGRCGAFLQVEVCTVQTCSASCCCLPRCSGVYALQGFSAPSPISIMPRSLDRSDTSLSESVKGDHCFKETLNSCNLPSVGHRQIFAVKVLPCPCNQTSLINFLTTAISPFSQSGLAMLLPDPEELLVAPVWSVTRRETT